MATVKLSKIGLQSGTDRTMFVTWTWNKDHTDKYRVLWFYSTGDGVWFSGNDSDVTVKQSTYNAPANAVKVKVRVKPISKTYTDKNKKTQSYWTADWTANQYYTFVAELETPPTPTVTINGRVLTARVDNLATSSGEIQFSIMKNDSEFIKRIKAQITSYSAACSYTIDKDQVDNRYKVRCRFYKNGDYSDFSAYSDNVGSTALITPTWKEIRALSATSVYLDWVNVKNADSYTLEYTTQKEYFNSSTEVQSMTINAAGSVGHAEVTGLTAGQTWHFRVRAVNSDGQSPWSEITSITIGDAPTAPTTWSSTTTAIVGEAVNLYWVHNSADGSGQTKAMVEYTADGQTNTVEVGSDTSLALSTAEYGEGAGITWRVKTAGATGAYGDWSVSRTITVYARPTVDLALTDGEGNDVTTVTSFPICLTAAAWPSTQTPVSYHVTVIALESYETTDTLGDPQQVSAGTAIYSQFFDTSDRTLTCSLAASDLDLVNNQSYRVICTVAMDSGLTAADSWDFTVGWTEMTYQPFGHILFDRDALTVNIRPYCEDDEGGELEVSGVTYGIYRRAFDGTFTEIASGVDSVYVTDPHPALDYARYRVVAIETATGAVSFCDLPGYAVLEPSLVLQWDENWTAFDSDPDDPPEQPPWSGSLLKLPYNIETSEQCDVDKELVDYIGRVDPVSYYGTNRTATATWSASIKKNDKETLYSLRRLARWAGDVYVREPSGSGYWASVSVSFSQKYSDLLIPVTISATRVEGGV